MPCAAITNTLPTARSSVPSGRLTVSDADPAIGAHLDVRHDRLGHDLRARALRLRDVRGRVVLRLHRTNRNAAAAAATRGPVVVALGVSGLRCRLRPCTACPPAPRRFADRRSSSGIGGSGYGWLRGALQVGVRIAGDAKLALGFAVPRLEIVVRDRPVDTDAESRAQPEIIRHEPQRRAQPVPRRAADQSQIRAREFVGAVLQIVVIGDRRSPDAARTAYPDTGTPGS